MTEVAQLLSDSWAVHKSALPSAKGQRRNTEGAKEKWGVARSLRLAAHALDPEHTDPAWSIGPADHVVMCAFYDAQLGPVTE